MEYIYNDTYGVLNHVGLFFPTTLSCTGKNSPGQERLGQYTVPTLEPNKLNYRLWEGLSRI